MFQCGMIKKYAIVLGLAVLGVLLLLLLVVIPLKTTPPLMPPPPSLNGYDDFIQAAKLLREDYSQYQSMSPEELRTSLESDREAMERIKQGLSRECRVPVGQPQDLVEISAYTSRHMPELAGIKAVAQMLMAQGLLAEISYHPEEAAEHYLTVARLGHEVRRGGLLIDLLFGIACESMGLKGLSGIAAQLNAMQCRHLVEKLASIEARQEPAKMLLEREHLWARRAGGWRLVLVRLIRPGLTKEAEQKSLQKARKADWQRRRLMIETAMLAYELEKGAKPGALTDLVPSYLKEIPRDPETGRPFGNPSP